MSKKKLDNSELVFENEKEELLFPLYYKNKSNTRYVCVQSNGKFEEITLSRDNESFRGNLLFGFDEQFMSLEKNIELWYHAIKRVHIIIETEEYENIFNRLLEGREEFFTDNNYKYIIKEPIASKEQLDRMISKHKWKPI